MIIARILAACLLVPLAAAARDIRPEEIDASALVAFEATYEMLNPAWMVWNPVERIVHVRLAREPGVIVLEYHMVMDEGEIRDRMGLDPQTLALRWRRFDNLTQNARYDIRVTDGRLSGTVTDRASGEVRRRLGADLGGDAWDPSMLDYVLALHSMAVGDAARLPFIRLGDEPGVAWASVNRRADEWVAMPGGERRATRVLDVTFPNGSVRTYRMSSAPPYKIEADTSLRWRLSDAR